MSDSRLFTACKPTRLTANVSSTATSVVVAAVEDIYGNTLTMTDFGDEVWGIFEPNSSSNREFFRLTGISSTTLTVERGIAAKSPYAAVTANRKAHAAGTQIILMTNAPAFYNDLLGKDNDETITGVFTFTDPNIPEMDSYSAPTDDTQLATKKYVDDTATGTTNVDKLIIAGTAGETVAAGEVVYMDTTDNEWKLADASATGTCENVLLGIAQGAGTNGVAISGGVLLFGRDDNQSGLAQGDLIYISDTAGTLAASAGTLTVCVGAAIDADSIYFAPTHFLSANKAATKTLIDAITASAAEINQLDNATITAAQLTEAGTFFGSTDISAAEAETLTDGSLADSLHGHNLFEQIETEQLALTKVTCAPGSLRNGTENITTGSIYHVLVWTLFETTANTGSDVILGIGIAGDLNLSAITDIRWDNDLEITFTAEIDVLTNQDIFFGFYSGVPAAIPANATDTTRHAGFYIADGTIYASQANNTTQEKTDISAGLTLTNQNVYKIVFTAGSDTKFYINGTLKATLSTDQPTGISTSPVPVWGVTTVADERKGFVIHNNWALRAEV